MKIITRGVIDWATCQVEEEDSYEYEGPVAECKDSGSSPQPTDPWEQAAAQYALSTGTANYNAGLNRTNSTNPLGSDTWSVSAPAGQSGISYPSAGGTSTGSAAPAAAYNPYGSYQGNLMGGMPSTSTLPTTASGGIGYPSAGSASSPTGGAPTWTESTQLAPQFNSMLQQPINDYNIVGDAGVGQAANAAEGAAYDKEMAYLQPQQSMQSEQLQSQLANSGATPGSAAYEYETQNLGRQQTFADQQAADSAIGVGQSSLADMANIGSSQLQNELAARNAPISEFNALRTGSGAPVSASTPDISGAFAQQYSGQLAGYNAQTATNNANTTSAAALAAAAIMYY